MIDIKKLIEDASLGDYLTIGGIICSGIGAAFAFWLRYKNRYAEIRKKYLEKINAAYHLFQHGENVIYNLDRDSDIIDLMQRLEKSVADIQDYHSDHPEALEAFDLAYADLTASWDKELNVHWQQWCNPAKGSAYMNGTRNWKAFSMSNFYDVYASMRKKLNVLRQQVRDSIS